MQGFYIIDRDDYFSFMIRSLMSSDKLPFSAFSSSTDVSLHLVIIRSHIYISRKMRDASGANTKSHTMLDINARTLPT